MSPKEAFATRLKKLREENGITQSQLADDLNTSRGSISYYEKMERTPDIEFLDKVSKYFHVSLDYLMGYSKSGKKQTSSMADKIGLSDSSIELLHLFSNMVAGSEVIGSDTKNMPFAIEFVDAIIKDIRFFEVLCFLSEAYFHAGLKSPTNEEMLDLLDSDLSKDLSNKGVSLVKSKSLAYMDLDRAKDSMFTILDDIVWTKRENGFGKDDFVEDEFLLTLIKSKIKE